MKMIGRGIVQGLIAVPLCLFLVVLFSPAQPTYVKVNCADGASKSLQLSMRYVK